MNVRESRGGLFVWLSRAAIIIAGIIAYANSINVPFIFDDHPAITDNPFIRHLWPMHLAVKAPPQVAVSGRPVVSLTLAINHAIDGLNVRGYHGFNLAAHILAALVLFEIVRSTVRRVRPHKADGSATMVALACAIVWVAHPLQTETVTYVSNRTELLMGLFYLLTLWCAVRAFDSRRGRWWAAGSIICCALGMGCKEVMVSAPLMVAIYDRVFLFHSWRNAWRIRRWLYLGLSLTWIPLAAIVWSQPRTHSVGFDLGVSSWQYLLTQAGVIVHYVRLSLWPTPLIIIYDWPVVTSLREALAPGLLVGALLVLSIVALWRRHWLGFAGAWFFLILAPSSSVIPLVTEIVAERRMYLPLAAVILSAVALATRIVLMTGHPRARTILSAILTLIVSVALIAATRQRHRDYQSELAIWEDAVRKAPGSSWAHNNYAMLLNRTGQPDRAKLELHEALRLMPGNAEAQTNLGVIHDEAGRVADAIDAYRSALKIDPNQAVALTNLARRLMQAGAIEEPEALLRRAVSTNPYHRESRLSLAVLLERQGKDGESLQHFEAALFQAPEDVRVAMSIGALSVRQGDLDRAVDAFTRAARLDPSNADAPLALGDVLLQQNKPDRAVARLYTAIELAPLSVEAHRKLGTALARLNRLDQAARVFRRVVDLSPGSAEALNNLGIIQARQGQHHQAIDNLRQALLINPQYDLARGNLAEALNSLATVQAGVGQFDQAMTSLRQAIEQATAANRHDAVRVYQRRLEQFQQQSK